MPTKRLTCNHVSLSAAQMSNINRVAAAMTHMATVVM